MKIGDIFEEDVNGIVIGQVETREYYRFYSEKDGRLLWDAGHFKNDKQAIEAFKDNLSDIPYLLDTLLNKEGVEMRCWA